VHTKAICAPNLVGLLHPKLRRTTLLYQMSRSGKELVLVEKKLEPPCLTSSVRTLSAPTWFSFSLLTSAAVTSCATFLSSCAITGFACSLLTSADVTSCATFLSSSAMTASFAPSSSAKACRSNCFGVLAWGNIFDVRWATTRSEERTGRRKGFWSGVHRQNYGILCSPL